MSRRALLGCARALDSCAAAGRARVARWLAPPATKRFAPASPRVFDAALDFSGKGLCPAARGSSCHDLNFAASGLNKSERK